MTELKTLWKCDRCKETKDVNGIVDMGKFNKIDKWFFSVPVPLRFTFDVHLCKNCYKEYRKFLKHFMEKK